MILDDNEFLRYYVTGLFDTDGCLTNIEKKRKTLFATFTQADENFINEVYNALLKLGIK